MSDHANEACKDLSRLRSPRPRIRSSFKRQRAPLSKVLLHVVSDISLRETDLTRPERPRMAHSVCAGCCSETQHIPDHGPLRRAGRTQAQGIWQECTLPSRDALFPTVVWILLQRLRWYSPHRSHSCLCLVEASWKPACCGQLGTSPFPMLIFASKMPA